MSKVFYQTETVIVHAHAVQILMDAQRQLKHGKNFPYC